MWILRGERALTFIKKCPVMFTHLNSLPNNQLRVNYMIAVWLELLKQLVFFWPDFVTQFLLKFKGRGYFMKASVVKLRKFSKMQAGSFIHLLSTTTLD